VVEAPSSVKGFREDITMGSQRETLNVLRSITEEIHGADEAA
jgi:hypothetical protein